jgi:hypothetical protein
MLIVDALSVSESLYEELKTGWLEDFAKPGATTVSTGGSPRRKASERELMTTCRASQCITLGRSRGESSAIYQESISILRLCRRAMALSDNDPPRVPDVTCRMSHNLTLHFASHRCVLRFTLHLDLRDSRSCLLSDAFLGARCALRPRSSSNGGDARRLRLTTHLGPRRQNTAPNGTIGPHRRMPWNGPVCLS